jgi:hypothetical protein
MSSLSVVDGVGFAAAGLVLATFCMRSMSALRWVAIASNVAFIAYGYLGGLTPVLLLHMLLLPVNVRRLLQLRGAQIPGEPAKTARAALYHHPFRIAPLYRRGGRSCQT